MRQQIKIEELIDHVKLWIDFQANTVNVECSGHFLTMSKTQADREIQKLKGNLDRM